MLKFLKKIFSPETIITIYGLGLLCVIFISGYHLFYSTDLFSLGKYLLAIVLSAFMLTGIREHIENKNKEK